jgi:opine dehydrogenase
VACIGHNNPNYNINVLSRRPNVWSKQITGYTAKSAWESRGNIVGRINKVSDTAKDVIPECDILIITSPAHTKVEILKQIKPYLKKGAIIGTIFGQGGFDIQARSILGNDIEEKHLTVFSLQYVPFICKVVNYGRELNIIGPKRTLYATAHPVSRVHYVCNALTQCYFIPCIPISSFLNLTLCPSN